MRPIFGYVEITINTDIITSPFEINFFEILRDGGFEPDTPSLPIVATNQQNVKHDRFSLDYAREFILH